MSNAPRGPRHGIARVLSKRGVCSRTQAAEWVRAGRVSVGGRVVRDPEFPTALDRDDIRVDGEPLRATAPLILMLNKPRGLVTTASDERGRDTVYRCFDGATRDGAPLPWIAPVGRLDKASEGLLLFSSDPAWAARITDPATGPSKTYHVQVDRIPDEGLLVALVSGAVIDGERLSAVSARLLRAGERNAWLEIVLDEGRNRQIRRLLEAFDIGTLRLLRVAIGGLVLGSLAKGAWRMLEAEDLEAIGPGFGVN
ncbi:MAG: rRNA pseudouridine synthase [Xanthomonadaceae bacterium]|nr:rRNA pseudouridine synthase [Xanthomonadaceae bacterium]